MSTTVYINNEGNMHINAKEIFRNWCFNRPKRWNTDNDVDLNWQSIGTHVVAFEYPIVDGVFNSVKMSWDDIWYRSTGGSRHNFVPTYEECRYNMGIYPVAMVDIVALQKGLPLYCFEIHKTNEVTDMKTKKLHKAGVRNLIELEADWIVKQNEFPSQLQTYRWLIKDGEIQIYDKKYLASNIVFSALI